jgi:drug/metabolite transporter (DMT)-like permease
MTLVDGLLLMLAPPGAMLFGVAVMQAHNYTKYVVTATLELVGLALVILHAVSHLIIAILLGPTVLVVGMIVGEGVEVLLERRWRREDRVSPKNRIVNSRIDGFD